MSLREVTEIEWDAYEWLEVTPMGNGGGRVFVRGRRKTRPPSDGYAYVESPFDPTESEQRWVRVKTPTPKGEGEF